MTPCDNGCGIEVEALPFPSTSPHLRYLCPQCLAEDREQARLDADLPPTLPRCRYSARQLTKELLTVRYKTIPVWDALGWLPMRGSERYATAEDIIAFLVNPAYWMAWELESVRFLPLRAWLARRRQVREWYSLPQAAEALGVKPHVLKHRIQKTGTVNFTRYALQFYIHKDELERLKRVGIDYIAPAYVPPDAEMINTSVSIPIADHQLLGELGNGYGVSAGVRWLVAWYRKQREGEA